MTDVIRQLRAYGKQLEAGMEALEVSDVRFVRVRRGSVRPVMAREPTHRRRWVVAVAAAAATILLGVGLAWLTGLWPGGDPAPVVDQPTVTILGAPGDVGLSWTWIPEDQFAFGGARVKEAVTGGGPGLVAVGTDYNGGSGRVDAAVWTSADGWAWARVPHEEALFADALMSDVVAAGPGLVAVGRSFEEASSGVAAVWTSADGVTWSRVPHDEEVLGWGVMLDVVAGGPGVVAVGAAIWTSPDGLEWSRVPYDEDVLGVTELKGVTVGGPGLVAVGSECTEHCDPVVVTSPDGLEWSRVPHDEAVFGHGEMSNVVAAGPGLVAVGYDCGYLYCDAAVWTSPDGLSWSRVPHDETTFGHTVLKTVTAAGSRLVAVGCEGCMANNFDFISLEGSAAVWVSPDGLSWTRLVSGVFESAEMRGITVGGPGLVAVGSSCIDDCEATAWVSEPGGVPLSAAAPATVPPPARTLPEGTRLPTRSECPPGSTPNLPGPAGEARPQLDPRPWPPVAMDDRAGVLVAVERGNHSWVTWSYDVCANTWTRMDPEQEPDLGLGARLVYDADSEVTVAFPFDTPSAPWAYSSATNTWTAMPASRSGPPAHTWSLNFVYEPTSGAILIRDEIPTTLWAYEVDTNTWTTVDQGDGAPQGFSVEAGADCCSFLTYDTSADRLVFAVVNDNETWTFDLHAGVWTSREGSPNRIPGPWFETGGESAFDRAAGRTVLFALGDLRLYDTATNTWEQLHDLPVWLGSSWATLVYDALNRRVIFLQWHVAAAGGAMGGDLWALDLRHRSWIRLLSSDTQ